MEEKDTSIIPEGMYCYTPDNEKNLSRKEGDHSFYIKKCPYFSSIVDEDVKLPFCKFLELGGIHNNTSEKDFEKLVDKYGSDEEVWDNYPLNLLWDQVKECGENNKYSDEDFC